eukprot:snap_masked-scaffold_32-processed-gene-2.36-mRNA-1 protein AED:1.00 eAED:1.00 QI:0/-1/0/0/-1/1/1/0/72
MKSSKLNPFYPLGPGPNGSEKHLVQRIWATPNSLAALGNANDLSNIINPAEASPRSFNTLKTSWQFSLRISV